MAGLEQAEGGGVHAEAAGDGLEGAVGEDHLVDIELGDGFFVEGDDGDGAAGAEEVEGLLEQFGGAGGFDDAVDALGAEVLGDDIFDVLGGGVDGDVGAELEGEIEF